MTLRWNWAGLYGRDQRVGGGGSWSSSVDSLDPQAQATHQGESCHDGLVENSPGHLSLVGPGKSLPCLGWRRRRLASGHEVKLDRSRRSEWLALSPES